MVNILLPQKLGMGDCSEWTTKLMFFKGRDNQGENGQGVEGLGDQCIHSFIRVYVCFVFQAGSMPRVDGTQYGA